MEEKLAQRIQLFQETGQVRTEVAEFVAAELENLTTTGYAVSEATAGMLTSHLLMALNRLLDGAPIEDFPTDENVTQELADHPEAVARAKAAATRAERQLGATLPTSEINFMALHLAVLDHKSPPAGPAPRATKGQAS